jgi:hypothetical protein
MQVHRALAYMRMAHKVPVDHPFVSDVATKGVTHAAMNAGKPTSRTHSSLETF